MSLGTLTYEILKTGVGAQAAKLPGSSTAINYDFGTQTVGRAATGTINKDDLRKAVGEQIKAERTDAAKQATGSGTRAPAGRNRTSASRLQPAARGRYTNLLSNKAGFTPERIERLTTQPGGNPAMERVREARAKRTPNPRLAEVDKRIASMNTVSVPNTKTVLVNQESLKRAQSGRTLQVAGAALRAIAALAPSPAALALGVAEAAIAPQARRPQARNNLADTYARLRAPILSPNFG